MLTLKRTVDSQYFSHLATKPRWALFKTTGGININLFPDPTRDAIRNAMDELVAQYPQEFFLGADLDVINRNIHFDTAEQFAGAIDHITNWMRGLVQLNNNAGTPTQTVTPVTPVQPTQTVTPTQPTPVQPTQTVVQTQTPTQTPASVNGTNTSSTVANSGNVGDDRYSTPQ
jgi:hypothetical protein